MMNRGENSDSISIPNDLILEILSRLPTKSVGRFCSVSKLWGPMLGRPYFTELFLTRSLARPRILFGVEQDGEWLFFSSTQPQNRYVKSSLVVPADFHMKFSKDISEYICSYTCGLIYFPYMRIPKVDKDASSVICNPITGQYAILPKLKMYQELSGFLGFDPISKQFKVLLRIINNIDGERVHHILTLGTENMRWRTIQCSLNHVLCCGGICINGVLYYKAIQKDEAFSVIVCFDVRSEKFKFVDAKCFGDHQPSIKLINYKGKLGGISREDVVSGGRHNRKLRMWVLEDIEKQEWSTYVYSLWDSLDKYVFFIVGVTATGEIVLSEYRTSSRLCVFYFNPERNTLQRVEIPCNHQVFKDQPRVYAFVDHVEYLNFNIMKRKPTSTSTSSRKEHQVRTSTPSRKDHQVRTVVPLQQDRRRKFQSINKFDDLCLLDDDDEFTDGET